MGSEEEILEYRQLNLSSCLTRYAELFSTVFPNALHLSSIDYLGWLYRDNPNGPALGFDAWDADTLAGHYVCIPVSFLIAGHKRRGLLSLNTAVHSDYRGKGLFTELASATYKLAETEGFDFVYGVANADSTGGFINKLDFELLGPLKALFTLGAAFSATKLLELDSTSELNRQIWSAEQLKWRCANPFNKVALAHPLPTGPQQNSARWAHCRASAGLSVHGLALIHDTPASMTATTHGSIRPIKLFIGTLPAGLCFNRISFSLPDRFRPSPLNLIYKPLSDNVPASIDISDSYISFLDFDAY
jgi:GNAT superfamily N-acetyltransferase